MVDSPVLLRIASFVLLAGLVCGCASTPGKSATLTSRSDQRPAWVAPPGPVIEVPGWFEQAIVRNEPVLFFQASGARYVVRAAPTCDIDTVGGNIVADHGREYVVKGYVQAAESFGPMGSFQVLVATYIGDTK